MAAPSGQFKPSRYFSRLGVHHRRALRARVLVGSTTSPAKLGLDLQGGTSMTMSAQRSSAASRRRRRTSDVARDIIAQRVDSPASAEAEVVVQGSQNIVVNVAGQERRPEEAEQLVAQAKLEFRTVIEHDGRTSRRRHRRRRRPAPARPARAPRRAPSAVGRPRRPARRAAAEPSRPRSPAAAPSRRRAPRRAPPLGRAGVAERERPRRRPAATGDGITPLADVKKKLGASAYALGRGRSPPRPDRRRPTARRSWRRSTSSRRPRSRRCRRRCSSTSRRSRARSSTAASRRA